VAGAEPEFRCLLEPEKSQPAWVKQERDRYLYARQVAGVRPPEATARAGETWQEVLFHAHERLGIFEYLRRNPDRAIEHFEASQKLHPNKSYGDGPGQGMADLADRIRRKVEIVPDLMLAERAERPKLVLVLASLYMGGWRDERALELFRRVAGGEFKEASLTQRAYARMKEAEGCFMLRRDEEALKCLRDFEKPPYAQTPFAPKAILRISVVLGRMDRWEESDRYMEKCYTLYPGTWHGEYAFYQMAFTHYVNGDPAVALRFYRDFQSRYPNSEYVRLGHVKSFIEACEWKIEEKKGQKKQETGK
jgi:tetratricopeptide (TPR) repeat protein